MRYRAVIFDLDGVICSTDEYHYQAWKAVADRLGIPFDRTVNERLRGVSRMESLEIILERYNGVFREDKKQRYVNEKTALYREKLEKMSANDLSEETRETLNKLRKYGILLAIGSSSKNAGFILNRIGLGNFFDAVSDGNNISRSKPDPEVFTKAADMLQIAYRDCLVVEDAQAGLQAAKAAGMDSAGMGSAVRSDLATYHLERFSDLLNIVR